MHVVGQLEPNAFGLYDVHGNVWEWTSSPWTAFHGAPADPSEVVIRGGGWLDPPSYARSAARAHLEPWQRSGDIGLRVVFDVDPATLD